MRARTGKNIELLIGYSAGGGYDAYARLLARHLGKHIPGNPNIVPNMPGGGGDDDVGLAERQNLQALVVKGRKPATLVAEGLPHSSAGTLLIPDDAVH